MATTTNLDSLVINYLTQEQYDEAQQAGTLNANQLYLTPDTGNTYGTVTSVGITNATNGGLSISGSPVTSSGSITVGHSNVLSSAQTTQAVYPIKIDKNGHISAYGSAVTIPTKTSDLTNDSGFITIDTKNTAGSTNSTSKLYLIGATSQAVNPQTYSNSNLYFSKGLNSTASTGNGAIISDISQNYNSIQLSYTDDYTHQSFLINSSGSNIKGNLNLYASSSASNYIKLVSSASTSDKTITFPNATGTVALTSDIPSVYSSTNIGGYLTMATLPIYDGTVV